MVSFIDILEVAGQSGACWWHHVKSLSTGTSSLSTPAEARVISFLEILEVAGQSGVYWWHEVKSLSTGSSSLSTAA